MEAASSANSNTSGFVWNPEDGELEVLGPLTPEHMEMFLRNPRFLGIQALTWREWGDIRSNCFGRCKVKEIILDFHSLLWTSFNTCFHALLQHLWDLWWQSQTLKDLKRFLPSLWKALHCFTWPCCALRWQFPDVSRPETLEKRYLRRMLKAQMQLLKVRPRAPCREKLSLFLEIGRSPGGMVMMMPRALTMEPFLKLCQDFLKLCM